MKDFKFNVEDELKKIEKNMANLISHDNEVLEDIESFLSEKSKRIRSVIALLYLKINNKNISEDIIKLLTAGELIHNASLLHDDVIDNANTRRDNITLSKKYNSKIAILSGDYLLSFAVNYLNELNNKAILNIFINTTKLMSIAEINQYINRGNSVSKDDYLEIIYGKTATLFEGILKSSAILSKIDEKKAGNFGKIFGILFQINNDLSDESIKNDRQNGIITIVDIEGIEKTNNLKDNYKQELRAILEEYPDSIYKQDLEELIESL